jgi:hypothetical protein
MKVIVLEGVEPSLLLFAAVSTVLALSAWWGLPG